MKYLVLLHCQDAPSAFAKLASVLGATIEALSDGLIIASLPARKLKLFRAQAHLLRCGFLACVPVEDSVTPTMALLLLIRHLRMESAALVKALHRKDSPLKPDPN